MESQNIDRRDSKKSNKSGGSKNQARGSGSSNGGGGAGIKTSSGGGEKQRSHSQKSGKRYQEIYKPPSLRSSKNRNSNSSSDQQSSSQKGNNYDEGFQPGGNHPISRKNSSGNNQSPLSGGMGGKSMDNISPQLNGNEMGNEPSNNAYSLFGNGSSISGNNGNSSVPSSPLISNRMQNSFNFGLAKQQQRMFNVNAKEFQQQQQQFLPLQQQQQQQQLSNFLSQFDPSIFYNNSPILASSGVYPLKQSKSSGNMNLLLQQAQQQQQAQAAAIQQLQIAMGLNASLQSGNFSGGNGNNVSPQFNRLSQSKSSGNVPGNGNRPRVRFDDEEVDFDDGDDDIIGGQLGNYLASLKMNGDLAGLSQAANFPMGFPFQQQQQQQQQVKQKAVPLSPQPVLKSALQKSRTGFYLNLYGNQQQQQPHQQQQQQHMQLGSPTKQVYGFNPNVHPGSNYATKLTGNMGGNNGPQHQAFAGSGGGGIVKRSRSFGPGNHHLPRVSATALLNPSPPTATHGSPSTGHSVYSDFCITRWPRAVQELVTAAVTGVERIPARNWIEMVNGIFEAMLCDYRPKKKDLNMMMSTVGIDSKSVGITTGGKATSGISASSGTDNDKFSSELSTAGGSSSAESAGKTQTADLAAKNNDQCTSIVDNEDDEEDDEDDDTDLTSAAVHIFLYFIQREKDRTVMESLLNTCFASFQRLSTASISIPANSPGVSGKSIKTQKMTDQIGKPSISRQWCNFLRFLSSLYSQVKLIRRQKQSQQQPGHSMDEMSFSLLALLCDSCLATLRSPQSYTAEMMGCLFTVLTSIGRDMEGTFPLKMKQLLAAVRDALLGIGPYHQQQQQQHHNLNASSTSGKSTVSSLSPIVQKTLMQLIELHAANWQLPASAVRYYYSSVSNSKSTSSSTTNTTTNGSGSSSLGNNQNQSQKSNNNNSTSGLATTSHNYIPAASSAVTARPSSSSSVSSGSNDNDETKDNGGCTVTSVESSVSSNTNGNGSMPGADAEQGGNSVKLGNCESVRTKDETAAAEGNSQP